MKMAEYQIKTLLSAYHIPSIAHYLVENPISLEKLQQLAIDRAYLRSEVTEQEIYARTPEEVMNSASLIAEQSGFPILVVPDVEKEHTWEVTLEAKKWDFEISVQDGDGLGTEGIRIEHLQYNKLWPFQFRRLTQVNELQLILARMIDFFYKEHGRLLKVTFYLMQNMIFVAKASLITEDRLFTRQVLYGDDTGFVDCIANSEGVCYAVADRLRHKEISLRSLSVIRDDCSNVIDVCETLLQKTPRVLYIHLFTALFDGKPIAAKVLCWCETHKIPSVMYLQGTNSVQGCALFARSSYGFATTSFRDVVARLRTLR